MGNAVSEHGMKAYRGSDGTAPSILNLSTNKGELSVWNPGCYIPKERNPNTNWTGDWQCPRAGLEDLLHMSEFKPQIIQPAA